MLAEFGESSHEGLSWETMKPVFVNGKWRFIPPDDPLFVVHFGLGEYHPEGRGMVPSQEEYARYKSNCLEKIASAVRQRRAVIFFTPEAYLNETIDRVGMYAAACSLFIPTNGLFSTKYREDLLGLSDQKELWQLFGQVFTRGELIGEFADYCVRNVCDVLTSRTHLKITEDPSCRIYSKNPIHPFDISK